MNNFNGMSRKEMYAAMNEAQKKQYRVAMDNFFSIENVKYFRKISYFAFGEVAI